MGLRIGIIGGGIGGLAAACALRREHQVDVLERHDPIAGGNMGGGHSLGANSLRILHELGIELKDERYMQVEDVFFFDSQFHVINMVKRPPGIETFWVALNRVELCADLERRAVDPNNVGLPVSIQHGIKITSADAKSGEVRLSDGAVRTYDVIVGADGVNSFVRKSIFGESQPLRKTPYLTYRCLVDADLIDSDPRLEALHSASKSALCFVQGQAVRVGIYSARRGKLNLVNLTFQLNITLLPDLVAGYGGQGQEPIHAIPFRKAVEAVSDQLAPAMIELIASSEVTCMGSWLLDDLSPLPSWSQDRAVLLGDAVHPVNNSGGQGAGMAIEDADALAFYLRRFADHNLGATELRKALDLAFKEYFNLRAPRCEAMRELSFRMASNLPSKDIAPLGQYNQQVIATYPGAKAAHAEKDLYSPPLPPLPGFKIPLMS